MSSADRLTTRIAFSSSTAKVAVPTRISKAEKAESVSGKERTKRVPAPGCEVTLTVPRSVVAVVFTTSRPTPRPDRSEEHTSELQSLMRNSYAVFCLKQKQTQPQ